MLHLITTYMYNINLKFEYSRVILKNMCNICLGMIRKNHLEKETIIMDEKLFSKWVTKFHRKIQFPCSSQIHFVSKSQISMVPKL